jgi:lysophospholipase L1-like esterase
MALSTVTWMRQPGSGPRRALCAVSACALVLIGCGGSSSAPTPVTSDPPTLTCPAPQVVSASEALTTVPYPAPTVSGGKAPVTVTCAPASGSSFPIGTTPVSCTATDAQQRKATCSLSVTISRLPQVQKTSFVAFGDSITAGEDGTLSSSRLGPRIILVGREYPTVLGQRLAAAYPAQAASIRVTNRGRPTESAGDPATLTRFSQTLGEGYEVVLIMEGTNDLAARDSLVLPQTIANLRNMLSQAISRNVVPYLATVPPMIRDRSRTLGATTVPFLNPLIRQLASESGVTLVDVAASFGGDGPLDDSGLLGADGLHPTEAGYQVIAGAFLGKLQATLERTPAAAPRSTVTNLRPR